MAEPRFPRFTPGPGVFGAYSLVPEPEAIMPLHRRSDGLLQAPGLGKHRRPSVSAVACSGACSPNRNRFERSSMKASNASGSPFKAFPYTFSSSAFMSVICAQSSTSVITDFLRENLIGTANV